MYGVVYLSVGASIVLPNYSSNVDFDMKILNTTGCIPIPQTKKRKQQQQRKQKSTFCLNKCLKKQSNISTVRQTDGQTDIYRQMESKHSKHLNSKIQLHKQVALNFQILAMACGVDGIDGGKC